MSLEDKPIGPVEAEMPHLIGSDPIRERTALDPMHHYPLLRDFERSPVTEVRPPSLVCFFGGGLKGIVMDKLGAPTD